ncbi:hypothetical protein T4E_2221 [Trichinella pseudospiralis]|uniref:Uncharacterized protein n=1 Tax=Trichinella pseudospiralis TaxID=6337 RepID=A0A0V0XHS2_TRIPS|nr:hypothetical protein T4E_2221 [Trichinella pseudospiralis]
MIEISLSNRRHPVSTRLHPFDSKVPEMAFCFNVCQKRKAFQIPTKAELHNSQLDFGNAMRNRGSR